MWFEVPANDKGGSMWVLASTDVEWKRQACRGAWSSQHSNIKNEIRLVNIAKTGFRCGNAVFRIFKSRGPGEYPENWVRFPRRYNM